MDVSAHPRVTARVRELGTILPSQSPLTPVVLQCAIDAAALATSSEDACALLTSRILGAVTQTAIDQVNKSCSSTQSGEWSLVDAEALLKKAFVRLAFRLLTQHDLSSHKASEFLHETLKHYAKSIASGLSDDYAVSASLPSATRQERPLADSALKGASVAPSARLSTLAEPSKSSVNSISKPGNEFLSPPISKECAPIQSNNSVKWIVLTTGPGIDPLAADENDVSSSASKLDSQQDPRLWYR
jgi:hypothetical protein